MDKPWPQSEKVKLGNGGKYLVYSRRDDGWCTGQKLINLASGSTGQLDSILVWSLAFFPQFRTCSEIED